MKLLFAFFAFFAVASAIKIDSISDDLQTSDTAINSTSGVHIRYEREYDNLDTHPKPADVKSLTICEPGVVPTNFLPVGSCHWMDQATCDPTKTGMFWFLLEHDSVYARCNWNNGKCSFAPGVLDADLCRYEWHSK